MSESDHFHVEMPDGRIAKCWEAQSQEYSNCKISAGLVDGLAPDNMYFCFHRFDEGPTYFFVRQDEMSALLYACSGAMWSLNMHAFDHGYPYGMEANN